jgi:hypothetical protein
MFFSVKYAIHCYSWEYRRIGEKGRKKESIIYKSGEEQHMQARHECMTQEKVHMDGTYFFCVAVVLVSSMKLSMIAVVCQ